VELTVATGDTAAVELTVATWNPGDRLSICLKTQDYQETFCQDGRSQGPSGCTLTSSRQSGKQKVNIS
jgi:hypothetical protein